MKVKVIQNHWIPRLLSVEGITLYPRILLSDSYEVAYTNRTLNHEFIHVAQIRKLGFLRFYVSYLFDYFVLYLKYRSKQKAYRSIPYEIEAYGNQDSTPIPNDVKMVDGILQET